MTYSVMIRNNETKEERLYHLESIDWEDHSDYLWTDGNFGCDCNLADFWRQAGNEPEDEDAPCGDTRFTPLYAVLADGSRVDICNDDVTGGNRDGQQ